MSSLTRLLGRDRAVIGMVHLAPLPGTPRARDGVDRVIDRAVAEAKALRAAGFDALLVENMGDLPYLAREVGPEIVATMTAAVGAVVDVARRPVGVQVLAGANRAALAVALAAGASFVRTEGFAYASVADEGLLAEADAGPLLRYRRQIGADHIAVLADVRKKHSSHAITGDLDLGEAAAGTTFMGADALVITGAATGSATDPEDLRAARAATGLPLVVGSGATRDSVGDLLQLADAVIVGSSIKRGGRWDRPVDPQRARAFVRAARPAPKRRPPGRR